MKRFLFVITMVVCIGPGCAGLGVLPDTNEDCGIVFTFEGVARSVCVSGDFNGWATDKHCLQKGQEQWFVCLQLQPGIYRYSFLVDGRYWVLDPRALWMETDAFGRRNGVVVVR